MTASYPLESPFKSGEEYGVEPDSAQASLETLIDTHPPFIPLSQWRAEHNLSGEQPDNTSSVERKVVSGRIFQKPISAVRGAGRATGVRKDVTCMGAIALAAARLDY